MWGSIAWPLASDGTLPLFVWAAIGLAVVAVDVRRGDPTHRWVTVALYAMPVVFVGVLWLPAVGL